jgi:hypothetical protein
MDEVSNVIDDNVGSLDHPSERRSSRTVQGIRKPRQRVFKPNVTYICNKEGLIINGEVYGIGDRINPRELSLARLRTMFDAGFIEPL